MKKVFIGLLAFAAIAMTGCQNEMNEGIETNKEGFKVFSGEIEQTEAESRTTLNEEGQVIWSGEEQISVFADSANYAYTVATGAGTKEVTFDVVEGGEGVPAEFEGTHYAAYPYATTHSVDAEGVFTLDMKGLAEQNAPKVDTYAHGAGYAIAQSENTEFFFQNVLAAMDVEFSLEGNDFAEMITINKITVTSAEGYSLTGIATAKVGEAAVITSEGGNEIVYTVEGATIDAATKYNCIIMVPAVEKANFTGLTLKVEGENAYTGAPYFWEGSVPANAVKFERNKVTYLKKQIKPIEVEQVFVSNFEQLQAVVDALTTTEQVIINLAEGEYAGALKVTGGKNIVLQPAKEGAEVVMAAIDHQSNGTPSTVVVNNIIFDNSIEIDGWFTGTSQKMLPCVGFWGGYLTFNGCEFHVTGASKAETGIMSWWTGENLATLTLNECTFYGENSSARAAQIYGTVDVEVNDCKFYTAKEYAIKLTLNEGNKAVLSGNTVENAQIFVRLGSAPYAGDNYTITFANNTLASGIALYDVDNYENQTVVEGAETKFYAADAASISTYLKTAASPANIFLGAKTYTLATGQSLAFDGTVNIFGAGMDKTIFSFSSTAGGADGGLNAYADGASLYFKDMKVVSPNTGSGFSGGFGRAANVKFDGCHYVGQWRSNGPTQFVGCTIDPQTSYIYTDYYDVTFDNCTFNASEGKAIQVYNDGSTSNTTITINETTFTAAKQATTWDGKPVTAIDINSNGEKFTVNITKSSATGFATGLQSGNDFWNIKGGEANVVINIDGEKVWPIINYTYDEASNTYEVFTPAGLVEVFAQFTAGATINIMDDLDMTDKAIDATDGNKGFILNGNEKTISNLSGTEQGLFVNNTGSSDYYFYNVKLENCSVVSTTNYAGLFVGDGDTCDELVIEGCEVTNCTVESAKYAAAFVAYTAGYNVQSNGPVYSDVTIKDCVVTGGSITGGGSTAAAIGHAGGNADTTNTITNLTVSGVAINGEDAEHTGIVVGTAHIGKTIITNATYSNVTGNYNTNYNLFGRFVPGTTGALTIDGVKYVNNDATMEAAMDAEDSVINVKLIGNATYAVGANTATYYLGGAQTQQINIDGNEFTLTFNHSNSDWNYVRMNNDNGKISLKNIKLSNTGYNNSAWNRHNIRFYNEVALENVTSDRSIALLNDADLKTVTISDVHPSNSEMYALWITSQGQTVDIDGLTVVPSENKTGDRGIAIKDQYVDSPAKVTLNIKNSTFTTGKKGAILVTSNAGAKITASNLNITKVAADSHNAVWVDEGYKDYYDLVTVSGCTAVLEGGPMVYVYNNNDWTNMNLWAWDSSNTNYTGGTWPGAAMTYNGDGYYYYNLPYNAVEVSMNLIANNGTAQNEDFNYGAVSGGKNYVFVSGNLMTKVYDIEKPNVIYLKPNSNWNEANARFAAYFFTSGMKWVDMTDADGDGFYECEVPAGQKDVIFCRMNPSSTDNSWDNVWNQSGDLTVFNGGNICAINDNQWNCGTNVTWSTK